MFHVRNIAATKKILHRFCIKNLNPTDLNTVYDFFYFIPVPPNFTSRPSNQTVIEGTKIIFNCSATGNPHPDMSWLKDGKTVAEGDTLSLETSRNDSGIYWCLAKNGVGEVINVTAYLDVQCKFGNQTRKIVFFQVISYQCYR